MFTIVASRTTMSWAKPRRARISQPREWGGAGGDVIGFRSGEGGEVAHQRSTEAEMIPPLWRYAGRLAMTPATTKPLRADAERNRQRLLAAAAELFAERGVDVTLDDVAHRAGVGVGTAYRRFAHKEQLIDALFEDRIDAFAALAEEALAEPDPWTGFTMFLERAAERHAADRGLQQLMFSTAHGQERCAHARERIKPLVERIVARAQEDGSLRGDLA